MSDIASRSVEELRACPFCGGRPAEIDPTEHNALWSIECTDCAVCVVLDSRVGYAAYPITSREEAIAAWNRRASPVSDDMLDWDVSILDRAISDYESSIASIDSLDSPMLAAERARRIVQRDALRALRDRTVKQDLRVAPVSDVPSEAPSEKARKLVSNHERVAMAYKHLGATELGDAERAVLDYIASLESQIAASRSDVPSGADDAAWIAERFHEIYERLAPAFNYETRKESALPWADVPEHLQALMIATSRELLVQLRARSVPLSGASETTSEAEARAMVNRLLGAYATVRNGYDDPADVRARNGEALVAASDAIVAALRSSPSPSSVPKP